VGSTKGPVSSQLPWGTITDVSGLEATWESSLLTDAIRHEVKENEAANDALCDFLGNNRGTSRAIVERMLAGEDPWAALETEQAAGRRDGYLDARQRLEDSRRRLRMLVILWTKRHSGASYRSMGWRLGVSPQMAARLGAEAAKEFPVT
jgi:hypothetical protein